MKKFKVIEESRFLRNQEMQGVIGGCFPVSSFCTVDRPYNSGTCPPHETCDNGVQAFSATCNNSWFRYCGEAVKYKLQGGICGTMVKYNALCGTGITYEL